MTTRPFTVHVSDETLDDLQARLVRTRWPDEVEGSGWDLGTSTEYLKSLVTYWRDEFDWRTQEEAINRFAHFRAEIDGFGLHFIHERGNGPQRTPLLLLHGWPDSFYRMHKIIPMLTDPAGHGGDEVDAFDVVVPSLPGFGYSDKPADREFTSARTVQLLASLMTDELGYDRFAVHGGDIGSSLTEGLARAHASSLLGIHLTDIPYEHLFTVGDADLSEAERAYIEAGQAWQMQEGAYALLQSTKPWTLAQGLNDSPSGLAAWIVEKFRAWSDCDGDVEQRFSKDELLTNITLYWATSSIGSSFSPYYFAQEDSWESSDSRVMVPTGVAIFPHDIVPAPRDFGERFFDIRRWVEMPRGGHFAALEEPELLADDIRAFFREQR